MTRDRNGLLRFLGLKECRREQIEDEKKNVTDVIYDCFYKLKKEDVLNRQNLCDALNYIGKVNIIEDLNEEWKKEGEKFLQ